MDDVYLLAGDLIAELEGLAKRSVMWREELTEKVETYKRRLEAVSHDA